jgi:hypothetical protein
MVTFLFATLLFDGVVGLLKSIRRFGGITPRATMRVAPDDPEKPLGLESRFLYQVVGQAGEPFTSSNFSVAKPDG